MDYNMLGIMPIPEGERTGSDIRFDETFEKLSSEIAKMSSPSLSGAVDWDNVLDMSADILANKSKDLLVTSYLCVALLKTKGLAGLGAGVCIWRDIISEYWEDLFPVKAKIRGRRNAIDWWIEKITLSIRNAKPQIWPEPDIKALNDDLYFIHSFLDNNMDEAPAMGPLISIIGSVISAGESKTQKPPEMKAGASKPLAKTKKAVTPTVPCEPIPAGDDPDILIRHGLDALRAASLALLADDTVNSLYFRLNRIVAWTTVSTPPPSHNGTTMIEPPDDEIRNLLKTVRDSGSWTDLLAASEARVTQFLFWIDLNRYVAESLDGLGDNTLAKEVAEMTLHYVNRLPGIESLTFTDGMPLADQSTRMWLEKVRNESSGEASSSVPSGDAIVTHIETDTALAKELATHGNIAAAIGGLRSTLMQAPSVRERFVRQIHFCRFILENNQSRLVEPYFYELIELIDAYRLDEWEPSLAAQAYDTILSGILKPKDPLADSDKLRGEVFQRLTLIDPVRAINYVSLIFK